MIDAPGLRTATPVDRMARNALGFVDRFLAQDIPFPQQLAGDRARVATGWWPTSSARR